jgi:hypothetical protein
MLFFFNSCSSLDKDVKEYRAIQDEIGRTYEEISEGNKEEETGIAEISELNEQLDAFNPEVSIQYLKEEEIRRKIEKKRRKLKEEYRLDSIKQARVAKKEKEELKRLNAKIAREEEARLMAEELQRKKEVAAMISAEEAADRNAYIEELKGKGLFLVEFDGEYYEVNQKEWNEWKKSENYDTAEAAAKYREIFRSMGSAKANELANSLYRTVSKGIAREGVSLKAIQGIQIYNVLTTGETKFD